MTFWSVDKAGNVESTKTGYVNISDPFAQADGLANDNHSHWRNTAGDVTITGERRPRRR